MALGETSPFLITEPNIAKHLKLPDDFIGVGKLNCLINVQLYI